MNVILLTVLARQVVVCDASIGPDNSSRAIQMQYSVSRLLKDSFPHGNKH